MRFGSTGVAVRKVGIGSSSRFLNCFSKASPSELRFLTATNSAEEYYIMTVTCVELFFVSLSASLTEVDSCWLELSLTLDVTIIGALDPSFPLKRDQHVSVVCITLPHAVHGASRCELERQRLTECPSSLQ